MNEGARAHEIQTLPVLVLFPHNRCNCRCVMCDIWRIREGQEISPDEIEMRLDEFVRLGVEQVVLSGGEPLMHSDLAAFAAPLRRAGIRITLLSSGLALEAAAGRLTQIADDLIVSLDGPRTVHDAIRRVRGAFDRLAEGVSAARRAAGPGFRITARSTVQRANAFHLDETVEAAREIGLDAISFLAVDVSTTAFNRPEGGKPRDPAASLELAREDLPEFAASLEALISDRAEDFRSGFIVESPEKLRRTLLRYFTAVAGAGEFEAAPCNAPWVSAVVETDGTVRPCFFHEPIGNLREAGSLVDVLNSPRAIEFRRTLDVRSDPVCRRCVCRLNLDGARTPAGGRPR